MAAIQLAVDAEVEVAVVKVIGKKGEILRSSRISGRISSSISWSRCRSSKGGVVK